MDKIKIAGHIIRLENTSAGVLEHFRDYSAPQEAEEEIAFSISEEAFWKEAERTIEEWRPEIEFQLLSRTLIPWLARKGVIYFHSSVVMMDGKECYLFTAPSGTGKSTHARLWVQRFGAGRAQIINDDKPFLRQDEQGRFVVTGSPWHGKENQCVNVEVPIRAVCIVRQAKENTIARCRPEDVVMQLLQQTALPYQDNAEAVDDVMGFIDKLLESVPVFEMGCTISEEAAAMAYEAMKDAAVDGEPAI